MPKKIRSAASESGYKLRTLYNEPVNLTISNGKAPFSVKRKLKFTIISVEKIRFLKKNSLFATLSFY